MNTILHNRKLLTTLIIIGVIAVSLFGWLYAVKRKGEMEGNTDGSEGAGGMVKDERMADAAQITDEATGAYAFELDANDAVINGREVDQSEEKTGTVFLAAGHIYGNPASKGELTPAGTLIDAVGLINAIDADIFFSLGDMAYHATEESFEALRGNFLDKINAPVINAPGNHDLAGGRPLYEEHFGQTYYSFRIRENQVIVLDTALADCTIAGRQEEMLREAISKAEADEDINHIFIFLHHLIYLDSSGDLAKRANGVCEMGTNYLDLYREILLPASREKTIYMIAGDVGAFGNNLSPYYYKYPETDLHTLAIGLGDGDGDALLRIDTSAQGAAFEIIPLGDQEFNALETYSPAYWEVQPH